MPITLRRALAATLVLAAVAGVGCDRDQAAACQGVVREAVDPASTRHVLPGAPEPRYATDPPTSGPHQSAVSAEGVLDHPLPRPAQVALLERGDVLIQYRDVSRRDVRRLATLAGGGVHVAPNPALPTTVVATAWTVKQRCSTVDLDALRAFAKAHRGHGAGH